MPRIVVYRDGGLIRGVVTDGEEIEVLICDEATEHHDADDIVIVKNKEYVIGSPYVKTDKDEVDSIFEVFEKEQ